MADEVIRGQVTIVTPIKGIQLTANVPSLIVKDTSSTYDLTININKDSSYYLDSESGRWLIYGFNLSHYLSNNGYNPALARNITINIGTAVNGPYPDGASMAMIGFVDGYKYAFDTGDDCPQANIKINNCTWLLGLGGSRYSERNGLGSLNGGAAIRQNLNYSLGGRLVVENLSYGWICGGGGGGEGRVNQNYAYAGGGAPLGRGWAGANNATLQYGGSQVNAIGNNGGALGQRGEGDAGGQPGGLIEYAAANTGLWNIINNSGGRLGPM